MSVTIELPDESAARLAKLARARGSTLERWLEELASTPEERPAPAEYRPISQVIADIVSDVPAEACASLPVDGASQVDHYLYGHPKR